MQFRSASEGDRETLYSIMESNMADYFQRFVPEGWSREKFDSGFRPERITVCEKAGQIVAFYETDNKARRDVLYVRNLQVRRGSKPVGRLLLERIESEARALGVERIGGKCFKANPALRWFLWQGFYAARDPQSEREGSLWLEKTVNS